MCVVVFRVPCFPHLCVRRITILWFLVLRLLAAPGFSYVSVCSRCGAVIVIVLLLLCLWLCCGSVIVLHGWFVVGCSRPWLTRGGFHHVMLLAFFVLQIGRNVLQIVYVL